MPQSNYEEAKQAVQTLTNHINRFSFSSNKEFVEAMTYEHRTLQQSFTRLCVAWLKTCASDDYQTDGRNKASHEVAKKLLDGHEDEIYLPMV